MSARSAVRSSLLAVVAAGALLTAGPAHAASPAPPAGDPAVWQILPEQSPVVAGVPVRIALAAAMATKRAGKARSTERDGRS